MYTTRIGRRAAKVLASAALAGAAAFGLAACHASGTPAAPTPQPRPEPTISTVVDAPWSEATDAGGQRLPNWWDGRPADRIAEQLERTRAWDQRLTPGCVHHRVVEHPDGGWQVTCVQRPSVPAVSRPEPTVR